MPTMSSEHCTHNNRSPDIRLTHCQPHSEVPSKPASSKEHDGLDFARLDRATSTQSSCQRLYWLRRTCHALRSRHSITPTAPRYLDEAECNKQGRGQHQIPRVLGKSPTRSPKSFRPCQEKIPRNQITRLAADELLFASTACLRLFFWGRPPRSC